MPGLKKLLSRNKAGNDAENNMPRRYIGKLQRRSTHDKQVLQDVTNTENNIGSFSQASQEMVAASMKLQPFPKTAQELDLIENPGLIDFDAEVQASSSRPLNPYIEFSKGPYAEQARPLSQYGLTVNTAAAASRRLSVFSSISPHGAGQQPTNSRHSASSSYYTFNSQESSVNQANANDDDQNGPITPESSIWEDGEGPPPGQSSKAQGKKPLLAIRDLDWSAMEEDEVLDVAKAYGMSKPCLQSHKDHSWEEKDYESLIGSRKEIIVQRWLNRQDFSEQMQGYLEVEEEERRRVELEKELERFKKEDMERQMEIERLRAEVIEQERLRQVEIDRLHAEEMARAEEEERVRQEELDRLHAEEMARAEAEAEEARIAAEVAAELARRRECTVCGEMLSPFKFAARAPTAECEHASQTCKECMESWMASEFETKGCDGIKCPECPSTLEYADFQAAASEETFAAYDKLSMRNALGSLEEFSWCLKPDCGSGQLNIDNNAFMECASCKYKQCLTHKVEWHVGETCDQYDYRVSGNKQRDEEKKTEAMLDTLSKKCPNATCGWRIEKISGCDHMKCKRCKYEFCWLCLASHEKIKQEGNTAHAKECKYHSHNLDIAWPFNAH